MVCVQTHVRQPDGVRTVQDSWHTSVPCTRLTAGSQRQYGHNHAQRWTVWLTDHDTKQPLTHGACQGLISYFLRRSSGGGGGFGQFGFTHELLIVSLPHFWQVPHSICSPPVIVMRTSYQTNGPHTRRVRGPFGYFFWLSGLFEQMEPCNEAIMLPSPLTAVPLAPQP